jgi:phosphoglycolate phosphatase-like HAD superfamily hydrolase
MKLGLVTSNIRANVVPVLGSAMKYFDEGCLFFFNRYGETRSKSWCLTECARLLHLSSQQCVYIGDQPGDATAALDANTQFLGVTYGWGITKNDTRYRTVDSVDEIASKLIGHHALT